MGFGHAPEIIIILAIALLIFGPKKLPEMGSAIGKSIKEFKKGMDGLAGKNKEEEEEVKSNYNYSAIPPTTSASEGPASNIKASDFSQPAKSEAVKSSETKVD